MISLIVGGMYCVGIADRVAAAATVRSGAQACCEGRWGCRLLLLTSSETLQICGIVDEMRTPRAASLLSMQRVVNRDRETEASNDKQGPPTDTRRLFSSSAPAATFVYTHVDIYACVHARVCKHVYIALKTLRCFVRDQAPP